MWLVFQAVTPLFLHADVLGASLQKTVSSAGGKLTFSGTRLYAFPSLGLELRNVEIAFDDEHQTLKAEKVLLGLRFPFFWRGEAVPSSFKVQQGSWDGKFPDGVFGSMQLNNLFLKIRNIRPGQAMHFSFRGDAEGAPKSLSGKGVLRIPKFQADSIRNLSIDANLEIKNVPADLLSKRLSQRGNWELQSGLLNGNVKVSKKSSDAFASFESRAHFSDVVYKSPALKNFVSPKINVGIDSSLFWDFSTGEWNFRRNLLKLPFGQADINGSFFPSGKMFKGLHVSLRNFSLDAVSGYYPPLKEAIPFNAGFSGPSRLELSMEGKWDKLNLHADWDLTPMLLTYAPYFSKPTGIPANLVADLQLSGTHRLSGNFTATLKDTVLKGALPEFNLETGAGEANIITNKFDVAGWEKMLIPFENYKLSGEMKLLANYQGNFLRKPGEVKTMLNLTLDNVTAERADGWGLKNVSLRLDFAPVSMDIKQFAFQLGPSVLAGSAVVYHPLKAPEVRMNVTSETLNPTVFLDSLKKFLEETHWGGDRKILEDARKTVSFFFDPQEEIKNFYLDCGWQDLKWTVNDFQSKIFGGDFKAKGLYAAAENVYDFEVQADRLDLSRPAFQKNLPQPAMEGNLFLTFHGSGKAAGDWQSQMSGEGAFSVTAGAFSNLDLLQNLSTVPQLKALSKFSSGQTRFNDLRSSFKIKDGKVQTAKADLIGNDVNAKADGAISLTDGAFNYRLDVFLSQALSESLLESLGVPAPAEPSRRQLGPIPFLLAGNFGSLELKPDPSRLERFEEDLQKKKTYKVFNSFLPEDFLFKRPNNS